MTAPPGPQQQAAFWGENLDPQNLGRHRVARAEPAFDWQAEFAFFETPDQRAALAALAMAPGETLLEIGAGVGTSALHHLRRGTHVLALDVAPARLLALAGLAAQQAARQPVGAAGAASQLMPVVCAAEALPFRQGAAVAAFSKSVLIHTDLHRVVGEVARVLPTGARYAFIEPLRRNPFVNLYRNTLAPPEWKHMTNYFSDTEVAAVGRLAGPGGVARSQHFYFVAFFAFVFQFALRWPRAFQASLGLLHGVDRALFAAGLGLRARAWFVVLSGTIGGPRR